MWICAGEAFEVKSMKVEKRVEAQDTNNDGVIEAGDKLVYTITVENDGEVNLFSLILEDTIYDDDTASDPSNEVTDLTVTHSYGNSSINLNVGETKTFNAEYIIEQGIFDNNISTLYNEVKVLAKSAGSSTYDVIEFSDKEGGGGGDNDRTDYSFVIEGSVEATKIGQYVDENGNGEPNAGDKIIYTITVQNTGNVSVYDMTIVDDMNYSGTNNANSPPIPTLDFVESNIQGRSESDITTDNGGTPLTDESGNILYNLLVGETLTFQAEHVLTQDDYDNQPGDNNGDKFIENQITINGYFDDISGKTPIPLEISDNGDDTDGGISSDKTKIFISPQPNLNIVKRVSNNVNNPQIGDIINFIIEVENNGNSKIDGFTVQDNLISRLGNINLTPGSPNGLNVTYAGLIEPTVDPLAPEGVLNIGEVAEYRASYQIQQEAVDGGGISNTFTATYLSLIHI